MPDPSIRVIGTGVVGNVTSTAAVVPGTAQVGDLLLRIEVGGNNALTGPGGGWVEKLNTIFGTTSQISHGIWAKTCVSGDIGASVTVTSSATNRKYGIVVVVQDAGTTDVAVLLGDETGPKTSRTAASGTATERGLPIMLASDRASATIAPSSAWTWPSGYTELYSERGSNTFNNGEVSLGIATHAAQNAGAVGGGTYVAENSLSRSISTILTITVPAVVGPALEQMDFNDGTGWKRYDILGAGLAGVYEAITLISHGPAAAQLAADFNDGTIPPMFTQVTGAAVSTTHTDTGAYGALLTPNGSSLTTLTIGTTTLQQGKPWASLRFRFKLVTLPGATQAYMNLCEIGNSVGTSPKGQFTVYWNNRALEADFNTGADATPLGFTASTGTWHTFEARVFYGGTQYTAQVRIDEGTPTVMNSLVDKTPAVVEQVWFGYPLITSDYTRALDNITVGTYDSDPGWVGATAVVTPPTGTALFGTAAFGTTSFGG